jgi:hypothetical protein
MKPPAARVVSFAYRFHFDALRRISALLPQGVCGNDLYYLRPFPSALATADVTGYRCAVGFQLELKGNPSQVLAGETELPPQL